MQAEKHPILAQFEYVLSYNTKEILAILMAAEAMPISGALPAVSFMSIMALSGGPEHIPRVEMAEHSGPE